MLFLQQVISEHIVTCRKDGKIIKVPFAIGVRTWCAYLEPIQLCITQGKPIKATQMILEKDLTK